jgi:GNAT superfamily N-acetyltransferase
MNVCIAKALRDGRTDSGSHPKPRIVLQDPPCFAIREATERDADAIFDLICFQAEFDGCFSSVQATPRKLVAAMRGTSPYFRALLAEADGKPIGFASFHQTFSSFLAQPGIWLDDLFVRASHRGHGVGNAWCDTWRYWPTSMVAPASIGLSPPGVSRPAISAPASVRA